MLAVLVLLVLVMVVFQISISTGTDARIARNQTTLSSMDYAIESVFLQMFEDLKADGEASVASSGGGAGGVGTPGLGAGPTEGGAGGEGGGNQPTDTLDEWEEKRSTIGEIDLRILFQDEDSKYNLLNMLTEDEDEARKAYDRVVRILDACRDGTAKDIDGGQAEEMASAMLEHMERRSDSILGRPMLLTDDPDGEDFDLGLPMSLREFVVLDPFDEDHFRDSRDEDGEIVHSIGSFLTIWTSVTTLEDLESSQSGGAVAPPTPSPTGQGGQGQGQGAQGQGQGAQGAQGQSGENPEQATDSTPPPPPSSAPKININRAPPAVLHSLMDDRDVSPYFWDELVDYRQQPDEEVEPPDEDDVQYDEFGEEIRPKQFFRSVDDLAQIDGWENLEPIVQAEIRQLTAVESHIFSVFVTARRSTGEDTQTEFWDADAIREEESQGLSLTRTVRAVLWRRNTGDRIDIVPLVRWEVLDYAPWEVLDYVDEWR